MEKLNPLLFLSVIVLLLHVPNSITISSRETTHETFLQCLRSHTSPQDQVSNIVYAQTNASYASILGAYVRNARFNTLSTPKPLLIVTPFSEHQVQATVVCAKSIGLQLKIRSGGHDFEGASYVSQVPFAILDMFNFQNVNVDVQNEVAVIQAGASLGQVYYRIWEKSEVHAFAAGACPTIGVGGHLSGGGYGNIIRKYGLTIDHVVDAKIVDVRVNKIKSDYVETPISKDGLKWISKKMIELGNTELIFIPYGGKMNEVPSDATPFPHRAGNLYKIQYNVSWLEPGADAEKNLMGQIRKLYSYMTPFVSKNPRRAFLNYRDLDIGINSHGKDNFEDGKVFGIKYFDKNFERLVKVKTAIDPDNFFWNEQSIPKLPAIKQQVENLTEKRQICLFI
uniref:Reticuline oxidase-like protein n=1 Tax=Cajanus cajan TaxID=3821 RepID=A0A151QVF8_CAJCA|nr:Reticuline oxidase-like protein [Cajanus cajan]